MRQTRTDEERNDQSVAFTAFKVVLKTETRASKNARYEGLCQSANANPLGDVYNGEKGHKGTLRAS